ncbi:hypothetical protein J132_02603 [Termitomyces sp. J132]|nr:hypothetical protein J132_02603 [Termitomyces sp. J132]
MARRETGRRLLTREERAMIRIMYNRGMNADHIAQRLSTTHTSVTNVIRTITGRNDKGNEWDEVNTDFIKEFPPTDVKESNIPEIQMPRPVMSIPEPKPVATKRTWPLPTSARPSAWCPPHKRSSPTLRTDDEAHSAMLPPFGSPTPEPSVTYTETQRTSSRANMERVTMPPDLETFLSNLEHDMSELIGDLEAQGLETIEHLLAFAPWPEERLHELFKATLPDITVPQRFMLVHGLKKYA